MPTDRTTSTAMLRVPFFNARQAATKNGQLGQTIAALPRKNNQRSSRRPKGGVGGVNIPPIGE